MNRKRRSRGQLSFDLGFAILLLLTVLGMVMSYWHDSSESTEKGRALMALRTVADYAAGNLNAFRNSMRFSDNSSYSLRMPPGFTSSEGNEFSTNYEAILVSDSLKVRDSEDHSVSAERSLGFEISCSSGSVPALGPGELLNMSECRLSGTGILCETCGTT